MAVYLWRIMLAAIAVTLIFLLIPELCAVLGFTMSAPLWKIIRICIGGLAIFYIIRGGPPWAN